MRTGLPLLPLLLFLLLVATAGCARQEETAPGAGGGNATALMSDSTAVQLQVVSYRDPESMARGLSYRDSLCPQCGMLFVFGENGPRSFWMKDMLFPLDMIFLDSNYTVVDVAGSMEPCGTVCTPYTSRGKAQYVLEVNAGFAAAHGVEPGKKLQIK